MRIEKIKYGIGLFLMTFVLASCEKEEDPDDTAELAVLEAHKDIATSIEHMGICYSPYHNDGQAPGTFIPKSQIEADLNLIAKHFDFMKTYTVADGMEQVVSVASAKNLEVAIGVHCYPNNANQTKADIDKAVQAIKNHPSHVLALVIGNETNLHGPNYVHPATVAGYMQYGHDKLKAVGLNIRVTSCITGVGADNTGNYQNQDYCGPILQKCRDLNDEDHRVIFMTVYPYYGNGQPGDIAGNMQWSYNHGMSNAENNFGLGVVISEIGWPTGVNNNGTPTGRENVANAEINFKATLDWVNGKNFRNTAYNAFWFEMFDETWKTDEPNGIGPSWGLYEKNGAQTPKFPIPALF
ncbi:MAG: hypothetical protein K9G58_11590 [Bacteroidales bacterium]|nr:hypothetical protein [Bacteroidales bacterium]MCF8387900.1 hypothetical protein [Bacteroidales bacterium]MCF8398806.1 hypothetical protein [Bacteroidales bacterium]